MLDSVSDTFGDSEEESEEWHLEESRNYLNDPATSSSYDVGGPQTMELNTHKAGMKGLDTAKINEIIQKASKGSKFYHHKEKCQERIDAKILEMKSAIEKLTVEQIQKAEAEMTKLSSQMELERDLSRTIVHVDMDMFYAAVEMRDDPSLRNQPMAVGSNSMLSTSNYIARKYGVRAAMPGFIAKKLCPDLVIVPCNFSKYKEVSTQVAAIFEEYDPNFCPMSLDEAYLDLTDYLQGREYSEGFHSSTAEAAVHELRKRIEEVTQLTASAGIAPNMRLAKVCSDTNKPDGQFFLPSDKRAIEEFVRDLPVRKVSGVGNVSEQLLRKGLGVTTCAHLWQSRGLIRLLFGETTSNFLLRVALGMGSTEVSAATDKDRKSISNETTFQGTSDKRLLANLLRSLCQELRSDMERKSLYGRVFTLKVKTTDFQVKTRAQTLLEFTQDEKIMASVAQKLLDNEFAVALSSGKPLSLRLLGVRMSNLVDKMDLSPKKQTTLTDLFKKSQPSLSGSPLSHREEYFRIDYPDSFNNTHTFLEEDKGGITAPDEPELSLDSSNSEQEHLTNLATNSTSERAPDGVGKEEQYVCPACSTRTFSSMDALNNHLDVCLNAALVKELVKETRSAGIPTPSSCSSLNQNTQFIRSNPLSKSKRKQKNMNKPAKRLKNSPINTLHKYLDPI